LRWVTHELTDKLQEIRIDKCCELLSMLAGLEKGNFPNLVKGDESWFTLQFRHSAKSAVYRDDIPQKVRQLIDTSKYMFTVIWAIGGFYVVNLMISQRAFNYQHFVDHVWTHLLAKIFQQGRQRHASVLYWHFDNCRVHYSKT
jgi:hypothetical protein